MSPEAAVLAAPARAWPRISELPSRHWLARPLSALFVYGCAASLAASGRVTLRLALAAMLQASFVPVLQIAALAAVYRGPLPFRRAVDLFFTGHAAVSLLLLAFAAMWGFAPAPTASAQMGIWRVAAAGALAWSGYVDYGFFRWVAGQGRGAAARSVVLHRLLWWPPAIAIFVGPAAWQEALKWAGM